MHDILKHPEAVIMMMLKRGEVFHCNCHDAHINEEFKYLLGANKSWVKCLS